ncbi:sulfite exporter TauE/SafE family protein [Streptomyces sp. NBC_00162]|uniref:sulfite exporter TauE/SafE family protein n=1 Tax=Streptomyces sp. NBC_00162 TaxID=2903629 RepID=UPI0021F064E4|nr:sulfite exporter TauE/SafE family protein [Streptomyces sp. NBC_00162]
MRSLRTGVLLLLAAVPALLLGSAGTAQAHPFGTPPVVKVEAAGTAVDVFWSAQRDDVAVLEKQSGGDEAAYLSSHIVVRQDGHPCRVDRADGMKLHFVCERPVERVDLTVTALTDADPAYRTLSVTGTGSGGLHTAQEPTRTLTLTPSAAGAAAGSSAALDASGLGAWSTDLVSLLDHGAALPLALLLAAAVGALHACAPGHGKSLAAGYLVGGRGRARDAVWLGGIVAVMHTLSVATLAVGWWLAANSTPDIAALTGWLQLIAALVVAGAGVSLLLRHLRHRQHHHSDHDPDHGHGHDHDHGHNHHIPDAPSLLTWRGLVLLGASGGLLPSPSAFLVLLSGLLTGKVAIALAMVAAFGLGMALTLTGVGLIVLRGRDALLDRVSRSRALRTWTPRVPLLAASAVVAGGTVASAVAAGHLLAP